MIFQVIYATATQFKIVEQTTLNDKAPNRTSLAEGE